jgi:cytochrome c oxidase subunit 1
MILPGMGVVSELVARVSRKQVFGYSFVAFSSLAIAILGLPRVGPPPVREQPVDLRGPRVLDHHDARGGALGREDVQLGRHDVQGLGHAGVADLLGHRLHGPVPDRRPDGTLPRDARPRHSPDRHVLRRSAHFHYIMVGGAIMAFLGGIHFYGRR